MATSYATALAAVNEIATRLGENKRRMSDAKAGIATALSDLTTMGTAYAGIVSDINAAADANPTNQALTTLKAQAALLVAEFTTEKNRATTMNTAVKDL